VRTVLLTAALLAAAVLGVLVLLYAAQERMIFFPRPMPERSRAQIAASAAGVESVFRRAADGTRLHAWHVRAPEPAPLVLYFGGNAEAVSWMIGEARARTPGVAWLLTDYRGYGASAGTPSERALVDDALAWFDHAAAEQRGRPIYLFGRSLGSALAVRVAAERPAAGVIVVAPFDSLAAVASHYYPFLPIRWLLKHPFDSMALAPRIFAPLLCLVAATDEIIPAARSRRLYEAWAGPKTWVELAGAGHNTTDGAPLFWDHIRDFLRAR
jgi:hypothetical protein